jgi:hypothetical protein
MWRYLARTREPTWGTARASLVPRCDIDHRPPSGSLREHAALSTGLVHNRSTRPSGRAVSAG